MRLGERCDRWKETAHRREQGRPEGVMAVAKAGELLFEFVRGSDWAAMSCELRCHGELFGWEAQFFERGELFHSRRFDTRALAVEWAESVRKVMEGA
jgi:hypothetical protein